MLHAEIRSRLLPCVLSAIALASAAGGAVAEEAAHSAVNMRPGVTEVGHKIYDLHMLVLGEQLAPGAPDPQP